MGQGEKCILCRTYGDMKPLNTGRKLWKGRPGQLPVQFGRQQTEEVQLIFSKSSSGSSIDSLRNAKVDPQT